MAFVFKLLIMGAKRISAKKYTRELALKPVIEKAIEVYACKPDIRHQDAAEMLKISENTLYKLRRDPNFWEQVYNYYMVTFEGDVEVCFVLWCGKV